MSNDRDDAQGRADTTPFDRQAGEHPDPWQVPPGGGPAATGSTAWGADPGPQYDQPQYGQPQYGQPQYGPQYGYSGYAQPGYGQPYAQPGYGQQYAQPPYGPDQPARPGTVITAAVLGLVHGALGLLVTVAFLAGGVVFDDLVDVLAENDPTVDTGSLSSQVDDVRAVLVVCALLALAWTVVMVWGSVLALRGRSRVLLLVGASIAVAGTGLVFLIGLVGAATGPAESGDTGSVVFLLVMFLAALATLVLLCLRSAAQFFAVHRQRRSLPRY
jgi:hypothetical protein